MNYRAFIDSVIISYFIFLIPLLIGKYLLCKFLKNDSNKNLIISLSTFALRLIVIMPVLLYMLKIIEPEYGIEEYSVIVPINVIMIFYVLTKDIINKFWYKNSK